MFEISNETVLHLDDIEGLNICVPRVISGSDVAVCVWRELQPISLGPRHNLLNLNKGSKTENASDAPRRAKKAIVTPTMIWAVDEEG